MATIPRLPMWVFAFFALFFGNAFSPFSIRSSIASCCEMTFFRPGIRCNETWVTRDFFPFPSLLLIDRLPVLGAVSLLRHRRGKSSRLHHLHAQQPILQDLCPAQGSSQLLYLSAWRELSGELHERAGQRQVHLPRCEPPFNRSSPNDRFLFSHYYILILARFFSQDCYVKMKNFVKGKLSMSFYDFF